MRNLRRFLFAAAIFITQTVFVIAGNAAGHTSAAKIAWRNRDVGTGSAAMAARCPSCRVPIAFCFPDPETFVVKQT